MTGIQDDAEHVLPLTIRVMGMLGHKVTEGLTQQTPLRDLLGTASRMVFTRKDLIGTPRAG